MHEYIYNGIITGLTHIYVISQRIYKEILNLIKVQTYISTLIFCCNNHEILAKQSIMQTEREKEEGGGKKSKQRTIWSEVNPTKVRI